MAVQPVLRADPFRVSLRGYWTTFSKTVIGDIIATAIAVFLMSLTFLACSLAAIEFSRAISLAFRLVG